MAKKSNKKKDKGEESKKPRVHKDLDGFNIEVDEFGELKSNIPIEELNKFLNKNVQDKKLKERGDYDNIKEKGDFDQDEEKD